MPAPPGPMFGMKSGGVGIGTPPCASSCIAGLCGLPSLRWRFTRSKLRRPLVGSLSNSCNLVRVAPSKVFRRMLSSSSSRVASGIVYPSPYRFAASSPNWVMFVRASLMKAWSCLTERGLVNVFGRVCRAQCSTSFAQTLGSTCMRGPSSSSSSRQSSPSSVSVRSGVPSSSSAVCVCLVSFPGHEFCGP